MAKILMARKYKARRNRTFCTLEKRKKNPNTSNVSKLMEIALISFSQLISLGCANEKLE